MVGIRYFSSKGFESLGLLTIGGLSDNSMQILDSSLNIIFSNMSFPISLYSLKRPNLAFLWFLLRNGFLFALKDLYPWLINSFLIEEDDISRSEGRLFKILTDDENGSWHICLVVEHPYPICYLFLDVLISLDLQLTRYHWIF